MLLKPTCVPADLVPQELSYNVQRTNEQVQVAVVPATVCNSKAALWHAAERRQSCSATCCP